MAPGRTEVAPDQSGLPPGLNPARLLAEEDLDNVAVPDDVGLALGTELAVLARLRHGLEVQQILVRNHLSTDEATGQIGVNGAGGLD